MEGTLKNHLVPIPLPWVGTPITRPASKTQHNLFQFFNTLIVKNFFLIFNLNLVIDVIDVQNLDNGQRSAGDHLESRTKKSNHSSQSVSFTGDPTQLYLY